MTKELIIIGLILALIYLYYQNRKSKGLPAVNSQARIEEWQKKYNQQEQLLNQKHLENQKLAEQIKQLETELENFKNQYSLD